MTVVAKLNILLGADGKGLERALDGVTDKLQKTGKQWQQVGKTLSTRVTLPLAAAGLASFKMASDAEEAANKFNVVMGGAADSVRDRLEKLTETIPLTRSEMEGLAAGIQDMLVPMGLAREEAAGMSADMVQLAGDLGSFNNESPDRVLEAMQSALAGASEPMRRYGVDTRVARLEALALEAGLIKQGEALDNTAMAQAVMLAIQKDSTDAMGDAARTVDSTANQYKFLFRNIRELAITIGQVLIPIITPLIQKLNDVVEWLADLDRGTQTLIVAMTGLAAAIGPVVFALGTMSLVVGKLAAVLTASMIPAIVLFARNLAFLVTSIKSVGDAGAALALLFGPTGLLVAGFAAFAVVAGIFIRDSINMRKEQKALEQQFKDTKEALGGLTEAQAQTAIRNLTATFEEQKQKVIELAAEYQKAEDKLTGRGSGSADKTNLKIQLDQANAELVRTGELLEAARQRMHDLGETAADALAPATGGDGEGGVVAPMIHDFGRATDELNNLRDRLDDLLYEESKGGESEALKPVRDEIKSALDDIAMLESAIARMNSEAGQTIAGMGAPGARDVTSSRDGIDTGPITMPDTVKPIEEGNKALEWTEAQLGAVQVAAQGFGDAISNAFAALVTGSQSAAGAFASSMLSAIASIADAFANLWIAEGVSMAASGNFAGAAGKFAAAAAVKAIGGMIAGGARAVSQASRVDTRATGGPVAPGQPTWVGERGPEMIVPKMAGTVFSNQQSMAMAGGGGINARDALDMLGAKPRIMSPNEAATDSWWREFADVLIPATARRNG